MSNDNINSILEYAIHPGELLQDALEEHSISQRELASRIDVTPQHINEIIKGRSSLTSTFAQKLEFIFGAPSGYWLNLQKNYEEIKARLAIDEQYLKEADLVSNFTCYKELANFSYVKKTTDKKERYVELLNFFGISSLTLLNQNYAVQYRKADKEPNSDCVAAWLRMGELHARSLVDFKAYDPKVFKDKLNEIRSYTKDSIEEASQKLIAACTESGVSITYTPYLPQTYINGATRWVSSDIPLIQMTTRTKRRDVFWFTFFHEAAHILKHSKKNSYVEWTNSPSHNPDEVEANEFAANILIPPAQYKHFLDAGDLSIDSVKIFAKDIGTGVDIVAGRLAKEGHLDYKVASRLFTAIELRAAA